MKEYEIRGSVNFIGMGIIIDLYLYMHSSPYLYVCGDDRIIYYPGADDLIGEPSDA